MFPVFVQMCVYLFSLTWCLPSLAAKACQRLRSKNKKKGDTTCVRCVCILQAASPWDRARWSPQAKQVGPVYLLHSGSCQLHFQLSHNTDQAPVPKNNVLILPHLFSTLLPLGEAFVPLQNVISGGGVKCESKVKRAPLSVQHLLSHFLRDYRQKWP